MIALFDHLAYTPEACTAPGLASPEGETLEMRQDRAREVPDRTHLVLESAISLGLADPATTEERLQTLQQLLVPLVERERKRGPHLEADSQLRTDRQRDAKASLAVREASHIPGVQRYCHSIGALSFDEGRRIAHRIDFRFLRSATRLSFRISR